MHQLKQDKGKWFSSSRNFFVWDFSISRFFFSFRNIREDLGTIPSGPFLNDSGVESSEFIQHQDLASHFPQDNFGSHATSGGGSGSIPELEEALSKLTPEDVEKRRRMFNLGM